MRIEDTLALQALSADYAHHLDRNELEPLLALFTADAVYANGPRRSSGQAELRAFFVAREARARTSRHFYSGLRVGLDAADTAWGTSLWVSYAQDGPPPLRSAQPFAIADFADRYRRGADGSWRISERLITPVYVDAELPRLDASR